MNLRNSLVSHRDLRQVWILEEPIIWLFRFDSERLSASCDGVVGARFGLWDFASREHFDVSAVLILYSALAVLRSWDGLDVDSRALVFFALNREVDIDAHLTILDVCLRDSESVEQLLKLSHNQLHVVRVSGLGRRDDLEQGHACAVVVNEHFVSLDVRFRSLLLHLDSLDQDVVLVLLVIVEEEAAVKHDWVVLLRDLIGLWKGSVHIVLPVELDLG